MDEEDFILDDKKFFEELTGIGIHSFEEQKKLYQIAKHCVLTKGKSQAVKGAIIGASVGVYFDGIGIIPGTVIGALAGMIRGTRSCMSMSASETQEIRIFANSQ